MQMLKSYYIFLFQYRRLGEWLMRGLNWRMIRRMYRSQQEVDRAIARLSWPGYLTAGINYYRANMRMFAQRNVPKCKGMPVLGIGSDEDAFISDKPLRETGGHVEGPYRYEMIKGAGHWLQNDAPDRVNALLLEFLSSKGTAN